MPSNHLVGPFLGINNRLPDNQLVHTERGVRLGDYLRNAVNVDLTDRGTVQRRKGVTLVQGGGDCHSLWSSGREAYYVDSGVLYRFPRQAIAASVLAQRVSFTEAAGQVVWSDGATINKIAGNTSVPLTQPEPNPAPTVTAGGGGSLTAGLYLLAFVAVGPSGESCPTWPVQVEVPDTGNITIQHIAPTTKVYVSAANGAELYYYGAGTTRVALPANGPALTTRHYRPMPPGDIVRYVRGRLLVAAGSTLFYSHPYAPGMYDPLRGYIPFTAPVTMVAPVQEGVFISADKTYFLSGADVEKSELIERLPFAAVFGTDTYSERDESVWWYSEQGLVNGSSRGETKLVQERTVAPVVAKSGASLFREQDGMRQVLSALNGSEFSRAAASSFIDAEVIRRERPR